MLAASVLLALPTASWALRIPQVNARSNVCMQSKPPQTTSPLAKLLAEVEEYDAAVSRRQTLAVGGSVLAGVLGGTISVKLTEAGASQGDSAKERQLKAVEEQKAKAKVLATEARLRYAEASLNASKAIADAGEKELAQVAETEAPEKEPPTIAAASTERAETLKGSEVEAVEQARRRGRELGLVAADTKKAERELQTLLAETSRQQKAASPPISKESSTESGLGVKTVLTVSGISGVASACLAALNGWLSERRPSPATVEGVGPTGPARAAAAPPAAEAGPGAGLLPGLEATAWGAKTGAVPALRPPPAPLAPSPSLTQVLPMPVSPPSPVPAPSPAPAVPMPMPPAAQSSLAKAAAATAAVARSAAARSVTAPIAPRADEAAAKAAWLAKMEAPTLGAKTGATRSPLPKPSSSPAPVMPVPVTAPIVPEVDSAQAAWLLRATRQPSAGATKTSAVAPSSVVPSSSPVPASAPVVRLPMPRVASANAPKPDEAAAKAAWLAKVEVPTWGAKTGATRPSLPKPSSSSTPASAPAPAVPLPAPPAASATAPMPDDAAAKAAWLAKVEAPTWGAKTGATRPSLPKPSSSSTPASAPAPAVPLPAPPAASATAPMPDDAAAKAAWLAKVEAPTWGAKTGTAPVPAPPTRPAPSPLPTPVVPLPVPAVHVASVSVPSDPKPDAAAAKAASPPAPEPSPSPTLITLPPDLISRIKPPPPEPPAPSASKSRQRWAAQALKAKAEAKVLATEAQLRHAEATLKGRQERLESKEKELQIRLKKSQRLSQVIKDNQVKSSQVRTSDLIKARQRERRAAKLPTPEKGKSGRSPKFFPSQDPATLAVTQDACNEGDENACSVLSVLIASDGAMVRRD